MSGWTPIPKEGKPEQQSIKSAREFFWKRWFKKTNSCDCQHKAEPQAPKQETIVGNVVAFTPTRPNLTKPTS